MPDQDNRRAAKVLHWIMSVLAAAVIPLGIYIYELGVRVAVLEEQCATTRARIESIERNQKKNDDRARKINRIAGELEGKLDVVIQQLNR